jgi:hypothetical protein
MIISMQGNWTVSVKSKQAQFGQRFLVQGAVFGNGVHAGTPGNAVFVVGKQWSITIQHDPGTGWQSSDSKLTFPHKVAGNYEFDIRSNDSGPADQDFNDLVLSCATPININDFFIYGNVTLYSGRCIFNPCRRFPFVIDSVVGLDKAVKNPLIQEWLELNYPERLPPDFPEPNPPEPFAFKPLVFDLSGEAKRPKTVLQYARINLNDDYENQRAANDRIDGRIDDRIDDNAKAYDDNPFSATNFEYMGSNRAFAEALPVAAADLELAKGIEKLVVACHTEPGTNLTLTFEEYDRTAAELAGSAYDGSGNRRLLGDTITDMNGNYIFRFSFDMNFPGLEDASDIAAGEDVNVVMYPDVIVKIVDYAPFTVRYESAPFYNIPNLKRINLCLPESSVRVTSACFNGNLIGSLGNVFIGGNQNSAASTGAAALQRYGYSNFLEASGVVSISNSQAGFAVECAAWAGVIDMRGCMYDAKKSTQDNRIKWYTIRIRRDGTSNWTFITQNYKHPKFSKRNLPNYHGDDVGPFFPNTGGALNGTVPAYINIQREIFVDGIDWEFSNLDRYMQLNSTLYDVITGVRTPGKFLLRVDGYDDMGNLVVNATDLIALFIHNNGLQFAMTGPVLEDNSIVQAECGLYRLTDLQMQVPMAFSFKASDPYGFLDQYELSMGRCPGSSINLNASIESGFTLAGSHVFTGGTNALNVHSSCPGYRGTLDDYSNGGMIDVIITPQSGEGWIKPTEYFNQYSFALTASQRVTNGYNTGVSGIYHASTLLLMERLT